MPSLLVPTTPPAPAHHYSRLHDLMTWEFWRRFGDTLGHIALILLLYALLRGLLRRVVDRGLAPALARGGQKLDDGQAARLRTLAGLINSIVGYVLTFVFGVMLLRTFDLDPLPLLTTASVAGLAVGFGAQKLVKDVISGFFILLENQYAVGDYVSIGPAMGTVEEVGMRTTRIRDDFGKLYILSNGDITQVVNQSRGAVETFLEVGVAADADVDKVTAAINAAGAELAQARPELGLAQPPQVQGLGGMDAAKLTLRVTCPVTAPARLTDAQVALRGLIHQHLVEAGIAPA